MRSIAIHTSDFKALGPLTGLLIVLSTIASVIGITNNTLYMDEAWANAQWLGQDWVTLLIAIPLLLFSSWKVILKQSLVWELVLAGVLFYLLYVYTFFVFEAGFSPLYFIHLPIFSVSLLCLFVVFHHMLNAKNNYAYRHKLTLTTIIGYFLLLSILLSWLWLQDLIKHITIDGYLSDTPDGQPPMVIYSLDLGIIMPMMVIASILLIYNHSLGLIMTGVMLTTSFLISLALMAMSMSLYIKDFDLDYLLTLIWGLIALAGLSLLIVYLNRLEVYPTGAKNKQHQ
jgi:hypothetical protein